MLLAFAAAAATPKSYNVTHRHLRHGGAGVLKIDDAGISFDESGKGAKDSRHWKYEDIQELRLGPDFLRILTYEDNRAELGRDRVYLFEKTPAAMATDWYPVFSRTLDKRFVAALADPAVKPEWRLPVKMLHGTGGSQGELLVGKEQIVYKTARPGESRTWRMSDIDSVGTSGPFDLTITVLERTFRFQLKAELPEARYQELWMQLNRGHGLPILR